MRGQIPQNNQRKGLDIIGPNMKIKIIKSIVTWGNELFLKLLIMAHSAAGNIVSSIQ